MRSRGRTQTDIIAVMRIAKEAAPVSVVLRAAKNGVSFISFISTHSTTRSRALPDSFETPTLVVFVFLLAFLLLSFFDSGGGGVEVGLPVVLNGGRELF